MELEWASPEVAILHAGVNDLLNKVKDEEIVDNLAYLGAEMMNRGVKKIAISSLTPKYGSRDMINNCNKLLKDMSRAYGYDYIDNSNIHFNWNLADDGLHLNPSGVEILEDNYARYLENVRVDDKK